MSHFSRLSPKFSLTIGVLSGALLLAPLTARAQDVPALPPEAPPAAPPAAPPEAPPAVATANTTAWTTFKGDAQRTGTTSAAVTLPLSLQWRFSSIGPARSYITTPLIIGAPGSQRAIFAAGGVVYAIDVNTGAQIWKSPDSTSNIAVPLTATFDR